MNKIKKHILLLILATIVVFVFVLKDNFGEIIDVLLKADLWMLIIAIYMFMLSDLFRAYAYHLVFKDNVSNMKYINTYKLTIISTFINNVTPFYSGGNPYLVYSLKKNYDVNYSKGISLIVFNFFIYQLSVFIILTTFILINFTNKIIYIDSLLEKFLILGYTINLILTVFIILVVYVFNGSSLNKLFRFLNKIKLLKTEKLNRINIYIFNFYLNLKSLKLKWFLIFKTIILNLILFICLFFVPIFVFKSLGYTENINTLSSFICSTYIILVSSFVPIPGGVLGIEYGFATFFGIIIKGTILKASLLLWRIITYYLPTLLGSAIFIFKKKG